MSEENFALFKQQNSSLLNQSEYFSLLGEAQSYGLVAESVVMPNDENEILRILPLAEIGLQQAATAFREAGEIEHQNAARLKGITDRIENSAAKLRKTLETAPN